MSVCASGLGSHTRKAAIAAAVVGVSAALAPPLTGGAVAAPATKCTGKIDRLILEPGLSLAKSASGTIRNAVKGTVECHGLVLGKKPTGPGVWETDEGTFVGNCANGGKGEFTTIYKIPTKGGEVRLANKGTFTFGLLRGGVIGGEADGDTADGTFSVTPTKGNCVTEPMSELSIVNNVTLTLAAYASDKPQIGDTRVFARPPAPGQPGGILVQGAEVLVSGTGVGVGAAEDWPLWTFRRSDGKLLRTRTVPRDGAPPAMGLAGMAQDSRGRIYVVDMNGRITRTQGSGKSDQWEVWATIPTSHLHAWPAGTMPYDLTFDAAGNAYIVDFSAPVIWRVGPDGGQAESWFSDPRLLAAPLGIVGVRIAPDGKQLYVSLGYSGQPDSLARGVVYALPLATPTAQNLREVVRYGPGTAASGLVFGRSGRLYVLLPVTNQVSVLGPDGTELLRFPEVGSARSTVPYDAPLFGAFDGAGSMLITNWAPANPANQVVLSVFVDDTALPLARPEIP